MYSYVWCGIRDRWERQKSLVDASIAKSRLSGGQVIESQAVRMHRLIF